MALGQGITAAIFGVFAGFWWSYALLVLGLTHGWYGIPAAQSPRAKSCSSCHGPSS
jgi:succinate-acetate transporter protein